MIVEIIAAVVVGALVLAVVLGPLLKGGVDRVPAEPLEKPDPDETPRGAAVAALKEIEFDRATGKLSDGDYEMLKARYTGFALEAMRDERRVAATGQAGHQGSDAVGTDPVEELIAAKVRAIRSARELEGPGTLVCPTCGPRPEPDAVFCSTCGSRLPTGVSCGGCGAPVPADGRFCESCGRKVAA